MDRPSAGGSSAGRPSSAGPAGGVVSPSKPRAAGGGSATRGRRGGVLATGAAAGLVLPDADDPVWNGLPLALRQDLSVMARPLVNPPRGPLAGTAGRPLRRALEALARMRPSGAHWHVLLAAPRTTFGGPTSTRARDLYALLERTVAEHLQPADPVSGPAAGSGTAAPAASQTPSPRTSSAGAGPHSRAVPSGTPAQVPPAVGPGVGAGLELPGPEDMFWTATDVPPLKLLEELGAAARPLVSAARGPLATEAGEPLREALSALAQVRATGAHWHVLLAAPREAFGGPTSVRAQRIWDLLGLAVARHIRPALTSRAPDGASRPGGSTPRSHADAVPPRPTRGIRANTAPETAVTTSATTLPEGTAVEPVEATADAEVTAARVETAASAQTREPAAAGLDQAAPSAPADPGPVMAQEGMRDPDGDPGDPAEAASAVWPGPVVPGPATMGDVRAALPQLVQAARNGTATAVSRRDDRAVLAPPTAASVLGWNLAAAPAHSIVEGRKRLGDLIGAAAHGRPQVLRNHSTPVAVLLPVGPDGAPASASSFVPPGAAPGPVVPGPGEPAPAETASEAAAPGPAGPADPGPVPEAAAPIIGPAEQDQDVTASGEPDTAEPGTAQEDASGAAAAPPVVPAAPESAPGLLPAAPATRPPSATQPPEPPTGSDTTAAASPPTAASEPPVPAAVRAARPVRALTALADVLGGVFAATGPDADAGPAAALGIRALDDLLGGLRPGRFYLVAAAPGVGASLLAAAAARTTALERGLPVLYAASGLAAGDVAARIVAAHLPVDYLRLRAGRLTAGELEEAAILSGELAAAPLFIDDAADLSVDAIAATAAGMDDLALVVVDRLHAVHDARLPLSGPAVVADAARALANLARSRRVPVLAVLEHEPARVREHPGVLQDASTDITVHLLGAPPAAGPGQEHSDRPYRVHATVSEKDFGTLGTATLQGDLRHARLLDPLAHAEVPRIDGTTPPPGPPNTDPDPDPEPTGRGGGYAPATPGAWPTVAPPGSGRPPGPAPTGSKASAAARAAVRPTGPAAPPTDPPAGAEPGPASGTGHVAAVPGAWPQAIRPGTSPASGSAAAGPAGRGLAVVPDPADTATDSAAEAGSARVDDSLAGDLQAAVRPLAAGLATLPADEVLPAAPAPSGAAPRRVRGALSKAAPAAGDWTYRDRDYSEFAVMVTGAVEQALVTHGGDVEAATEALKKAATGHAMALFERTRVRARYDYRAFPELQEFVKKQRKHGPDQVWEGRHNWTNQRLLADLAAGEVAPLVVDLLDTNAAYLSAFQCHLPIGELVHAVHTNLDDPADPGYGFRKKRSGIYLLDSRPTWDHADLPDPIGNRESEGPVYLTDPTIRLLLQCAKDGLCAPPAITQSWTSGSTEIFLETFRRTLILVRTRALRDGDRVTEEYVKAMYSKFVSTLGESSANRDITRPDWMHIIRSQAFANLWRKGHKARKNGLTLVAMTGTDELHLTGGDWRPLFPEGRAITEMKVKNRYALPHAA